MKYIIFGAGKYGKLVLDFLGHNRVERFVDNNITGEYLEKEISPVSILKDFDLEDRIIVIASENYKNEMAKQIEAMGIKKYFCFDTKQYSEWSLILPHYYLNKQYETVTYNRLLAKYDLQKYKHITILGTNRLLPYLISELSIQSDYSSIYKIVDLDCEEGESIGIEREKWKGYKKDLTDCLIVNVTRAYSGISEIVREYKGIDIIYMYDADIVEQSFFHYELGKYRNIHQGKRIFIVGNGPSMTIRDLETLHFHGEICIASNKIYKIYNQTKWRADYIAMYDQNIVEDCIGDIENVGGTWFVGDSYHFERPDNPSKGVQYFHINNSDRNYKMNGPGFSEDFVKGFYDGYTVTYTFGIQFAIYTGAKEIILVGCDHNYQKDVTDEENHFIPNYYEEKQKARYRKYGSSNEAAMRAYKVARDFCEKNDIRIYNATRGGKLEVFERVNFDDLFGGKLV